MENGHYRYLKCFSYSSQSGEIHVVGEEGDVMAGKGWLWYVQGVQTLCVILWGKCFPLWEHVSVLQNWWENEFNF